jgi:hypothetical protein
LRGSLATDKEISENESEIVDHLLTAKARFINKYSIHTTKGEL